MKQRFSLRYLWHPHQKLWNANLIQCLHLVGENNKLKARIHSIIVALDTMIWQLKTKKNFLNLHLLYKKEQSFKLNYFDLGTHRQANELVFFIEHILPQFNCSCNIYAFEAWKEFYEEAKEKTKKYKNVRIFNLALSDAIPSSGLVRLYYFGQDGLGNSVYRERNQIYEDVQACRLSDFIQEHKISLEGAVNILRMNIEGSEFDVISDLVKSGLRKYFDGFYGMWDDVWKIDPTKDVLFITMMKKARIRTVPFNGRDLGYPSRLKMIKENMTKLIVRSARDKNPIRK